MRFSFSFCGLSFSMQSSACALSMLNCEVLRLEYSPRGEVSGEVSTIRRIVTERIFFLVRMRFSVFAGVIRRLSSLFSRHVRCACKSPDRLGDFGLHLDAG